MCFVGTIFLSLGIGLTQYITNIYIAILLCFFWTIGEMILFPILLPLILKLSTFKRGNSVGIYQTVFSLSIFISPVIGMSIYKLSPILRWNICLCAGILSSIFFVTINAIKRY